VSQQLIVQLLTNDDVFYIRFMDDWVVMDKTRRQLRKAVKQTHPVLCQLKLETHTETTCIRLVEKGFDFLGYHFTPNRAEYGQKNVG
jgi:RNA-directed DNA polymerase